MCQSNSIVTVIVPVFNESNFVERSVSRLFALDFSKQVILVDDGSSDETPQKIADLAKQFPTICCIRHAKNLGKGSSIRSALERAEGAFVAIYDADLEYSAEDLSLLVVVAKKNVGAIVYGTRYTLNNPLSFFSSYKCGVWLINMVVWLLYRTRLSDVMTCYKVFPTSRLKAMHLSCKRFEFCSEVTAKAIRMGIQIIEVPISYWPRSKKQGKKIRLADGWPNIRVLFRYRKWCPQL